ncbi:putative suppressor of white apricot domain-containing protein [Lupinus albus]|uniref:Putative suppressor of white apricot domain-containing protein n=1 Tax=Lupinus albus TaxID=3870 RepID=A0A6A4P1D0_LUPAL|nr:putative suppressor of white apricot domain-containing protein [Lupinus albus]
MDLEVVGRHAMLFDDDNLAAFVNSDSALVDWNSLSIDRYDVRHLLPYPLPPRPRPRHLHRPSFELDIDHERYLDLPSSSPNQLPQDDGSDPVISDGDGYRAVPFKYANPNDPAETRDNDTESGYLPPFPVPESLLQSLVSDLSLNIYFRRVIFRCYRFI